MTRLFLLALVLGLATTAADAQNQSVDSRIYTEDPRHGGRFYESYDVELQPGDVLSVVVTSGDFDPMIYVKSPAENWANNDDCTQGDTTRSCLEMTAEETGTYEVWAMTYERGAYGDYHIDITVNE